MSTLFCIYSPHSHFSTALVHALAPLGGVSHLHSTADVAPQTAAIIFVCEPFHKPLHLPAHARVIHLSFFEDTLPSPLSLHTYFIHRAADPVAAAAHVAKILQGFESMKSWIFTPFPNEVSGHSHIVPVQPFVPKASTVTPTPIAPPIQTPTTPKRAVTVNASKPKRHIARPKVIISIPKIRVSPRMALALVSLILWILFLPYVSIAVSSACSFAGVRSLTRMSFATSARFFSCSKAASVFTIEASGMLRNGSTASFAQFLLDAASIGSQSADIAEALKTDSSIPQVQAMSPALSHLSRDLSLLSAREQELSMARLITPELTALLAKAPLVNVLGSVAQQAPKMLGENSTATYLVLLQNNMELRPTGGFIGSFLLLDVQEGKVTTHKVYDVYDADGQLAGFVAPPEPIARYLGEAKWYMRDSNWDPDFAVSAKRAAWFLEKSLGHKVTGVIGINLEVLRTIIKNVGPLEIPDYGGALTEQNFYSKIQDEVHREFFPGSRKKSNYLTAVVSGALTRLSDRGQGSFLPLLLGLSDNIASRDIQIYSPDSLVQDSIIKAGIGGDIAPNSIGFIEANLGVNKANQFIERTGSLQVQRRGVDLRIVSTLILTNTATSATDETRYRVYVRSFVPKRGVLESMKITSSGIERAVIPEKSLVVGREEVGSFFEVKAGEQGIVTATWSIPTTPELVFWKQGGVASYPFQVTTLTEGGEKTYNTNLSADTRISL